MVGMPSREDIELFYNNDVAVPTTMETWTRSSASEESANAYYRNSKGSYSSTKGKSNKCGVCALIRVSTTQNDNALLSTSRPDFNAIKQQLELEESEYNLAIAKTQNDQKAVAESTAVYQASYASYLSAVIEYNESIVNNYGAMTLSVKGDPNGDNKVNAADATTVLKHVVGIQKLNGTAYDNADINGDGKVNAADATAILKMVVGIR